MTAAKPQIIAWVTRVKKPAVDGNQVISDFIKYASEQNKIYNPIVSLRETLEFNSLT